MNRQDIRSMADMVEAIEDEIAALTSQDPYHPQIGLLRERLHNATSDLYRSMPRGV